MSETLLDELIQRVEGLDPKQQKEITEAYLEDVSQYKWIPNPGPQTDCYQSLADMTFYGGAGGGGKTDLLLGLAFNEHTRSLIMRRQYTDLSAITERAIEINGTRQGYKGSPPPKLRPNQDQLIEFGAAKDVGDEEHWRGQPHDFLGIDEAAQWAEIQIRFLMGWVRSTREGQRTRVVLCSNPPMAEEGAWLISMFAPWLDPTHPNPAKPGELRWFVSDEEGNDREVDGPGPHRIDGKDVMALSRTYIPAKVQDNPYLAGTQYEQYLDALPEPFRSALRDGDFRMGIRDHELQVIPLDWIRKAQARWTPQPPEGVPMCAIGVDAAAGGDDRAVIAPRYDGYYPKPEAIPGRDVPYGTDLAARVVKSRREPAVVVIDMGGGYGGACFDHLKANDIPVYGHKGSEKSTVRTKEKQLGFFNKRAEVHWRFREALDPSQPGGSWIALPPDPELVSDLTSIRIESVDTRGIKLEPKKNLVKRIGRSPDKGDAVVIAWSQGNKHLTHLALGGSPAEMGTRRRKQRPSVEMGHPAARRKLRR